MTSRPMVGGSQHRAQVGCLAALLGGVAMAADDPQFWLSRMEGALATRNYQGVFVHEHTGQTETLRIIHRVDGSAITERIWSMDGSGREFVRKGNELISYLPDQRLVLVEQSRDSGLLLAELRRLDAAASGQYHVSEIARTRVSGRQARVIAVDPQDEFRYGYRLWIDEATAMPLKTQLRTSRGRVVEQIVFTELTLPGKIADTAFEPQLDARGYRWLRHDAVANTVQSDAALAAAWQARELPPGFKLTARSTQVFPGGAGPVTHLVFSDGLASVSVFVEQSSQPPGNARAPAAAAVNAADIAGSDIRSVGSSSAFSTTVQGHKVTAIGEVPPDTVRAIASSMLAAPGNVASPAADGRPRGGAAGPAVGSRGAGGRR